ncbi:tRNA (adenosine(37)-N6)-threonylcarbamoyltransferase complex ATPase subunit type 1 TsaE [Melghirimyces algeriensis]|uniref:tRNA threonylcarbamoyladenosine biosynthesis protein TsaE n=1 Tax=Melghirimyces algeriensis TaxID=910412 RepID=A0A521FEN3_9BACL|nr:tRNA (adenosine(37)-N6)-threonylcarbamoyltransferase complex ATPase subunit type 1 TsaE [Melghirimyces algeriensis]SMO94444.1 tRNA threonylcarbamoyladenosine biosynthesis protein TsaE [Melghirimyces algeriensis]
MDSNFCLFQTNSPRATRSLAMNLAKRLQPGDVITLEGDLGAGKTTFMQGVGKGLGIEAPIDSPTFTLIKEYEQGRIPLYHMDVYRLDSTVEELGWDEYFYGEGVTFVEWASRIQPLLPEDVIRIEIVRQENEVRMIKVEPPVNEVERICKGLSINEIAGD